MKTYSTTQRSSKPADGGVMMLGLSVRLIPLNCLAAELRLTPAEAREFLQRLGVRTMTIGRQDCCDMFGLEWAWHRYMNPELWQVPDSDIPSIIRQIGQMYETANRAALLSRLNELGRAIVPDIRRRKTCRQSQAAHRRRHSAG